MLTLVGMGIGLPGCAGPATPHSAGPSMSSSPPVTGTSTKPSRRAPLGVIGQISAKDGLKWTVVNRAGKNFTVNITPQTQFGTKRQPATEQQFIVGSPVRVIGTMDDTTITVTAIRVETMSNPTPSASVPVAPSTTATTTTTTAAAGNDLGW